jgi:hypothetical protein
MKKITQSLFLLSAFIVMASTTIAQNLRTIQQTNNPISQQQAAAVYKSDPADVHPASSGAKSAPAINCTDKINYCGNQAPFNVKVGSAMNSFGHIDGVYQVFPEYVGSVTGVEVDAAKFAGSSNPTMYVRIFDVTSWGDPDWNAPLTAGIALTINNTSSTSYVVTFPSPVPITNPDGFAVGFINWIPGSTDSCRLFTGPQISSSGTYYSFVTVVINSNTYAFPNYFANSFNAHSLIRPIVTTSVNAILDASKTSTGCAMPVTYNFNNWSPYPSNYVYNPMICPGGVTYNLDYGDGSPIVNNFNWSGTWMHNYTTVGTYTPTYTQTYLGWTNNCADTKTIQVDALDPKPSFNFNIGGFTVFFTNTSTGMTNFKWNFGDLGTSTQTDPTHIYTSPGTYVIELEADAPCGKVKYTTSIVITGTTSIAENSMNNSLAVFPNPVSAALKVSYKGHSNVDANIEIYNSIGAMVKTIRIDLNNGSANIDVSELNKGMYFIKLKGDNGDLVRSFVKD